MMRRSLSLMNWREQGISYVKYLNVCTEALHSTVKERSKAKYIKYSTPGYVAQKPDGFGGMELVEKVGKTTQEY